MSKKFILSCESTADLPHTYIDQNNIQILMCKKDLEGTAYYRDYFRSLLEQGNVLHIAFGTSVSELSSPVMKAALAVRDEYPERKLIITDSVRSASGYKMLVEIAVDLRGCGESAEDAAKWISNLRPKVHSHLWNAEPSEASVKSAICEMADCLDGDYSYSGKCCVSHIHAPAQAEAVRACVERTFPNLKGKVQINEFLKLSYAGAPASGVALCYMG